MDSWERLLVDSLGSSHRWIRRWKAPSCHLMHSGSTWCHLTSSELIGYHLGLSGHHWFHHGDDWGTSGATWIIMEPSGTIWGHLGEGGDLEPLVAIWVCLVTSGPSGAIWTHWDHLGPPGSHLDPSGTIWSHLESFLERSRNLWRISSGIPKVLFEGFLRDSPWNCI